jgi:hypothetical protein
VLRLDVERLNKRQSMDQTMEKLGQDLEGNNTTLEHSDEEKLEDSVIVLHGLWKEFEKLKNNQVSESTNQKEHSLLRQMVEKLGHLV